VARRVLADVDYTPLNFIYGDGNVQSTIEELALWDQALYGDRLVQAATLQQAFTPGKLRDGKVIEYGFGWYEPRLRASPGRPRWLLAGVQKHAGSLPRPALTVILLSNIEQFDREVLASKIARLYLRDHMVLPKTVTLPPNRLAAYAGRYALGTGADYEVTEQNGTLWLTEPNGQQHRLAAPSRDRSADVVRRGHNPRAWPAAIIRTYLRSALWTMTGHVRTHITWVSDYPREVPERSRT
jgi:hypothetical protein